MTVDGAAETPTIAEAQEVRLGPRLLSLLLALLAVVSLISALTPPLERRTLDEFVPAGISRGASAIVAALSIVLLFAALGLRRRKHRSWVAAVVILSVNAVLHVLKGLDVDESILTIALLVALVRTRSQFHVESDPESTTRFARHAAAAAGGGIALGLGANIVQPVLVGHGYPGIWRSLVETLGDLVGDGPDRISGDGSHVIANALVVWTVLAVLWLAFLFVRPRRQFVRQRARDRADARTLVASQGHGSLDYFALRRDKDYFFDDRREAFLAYRVTAGIAVVSGDPIGAPEAADRLIAEFVRFGWRHGWRIVGLGVRERHLAAFHAAGLQSVYLGDEAVIDTAAFSLEGRAIRKTRQSVTRLRKAGYRVDVRSRARVDPELRHRLEDVSRVWLGGQPDRGFSMAMDDIWSGEHADCVFAIALDAEGAPAGFIHLVPVDSGRGLSLSAMRRLPETPNGLMEFTICELAAWCREHGVRAVSLNFNAFGSILRASGEGGELPRWQRLLAYGLTKADRYFQVNRLLRFNQKFAPAWTARYAVFERRADLPYAAIVLLTLEALIAVPRPLRALWRQDRAGHRRSAAAS
jgi:lysyl-tRNA synthetase, class II